MTRRPPFTLIPHGTASCVVAITSPSSSSEGTCAEAARRFYVAAMTTSMRFGSPLAIPASMLGAMSLARVTR